jgi:hypothetical protein
LRAAGFTVTPFPVTLVLPVVFVAIAQDPLRGRRAPPWPRNALPTPQRKAAVSRGGQWAELAALTDLSET